MSSCAKLLIKDDYTRHAVPFTRLTANREIEGGARVLRCCGGSAGSSSRRSIRNDWARSRHSARTHSHTLGLSSFSLSTHFPSSVLSFSRPRGASSGLVIQTINLYVCTYTYICIYTKNVLPLITGCRGNSTTSEKIRTWSIIVGAVLGTNRYSAITRTLHSTQIRQVYQTARRVNAESLFEILKNPYIHTPCVLSMR